MKKVGTLYGNVIVEGDPNRIKNEILLIKDNISGQIKSIKQIGNNNTLQEIIPDEYLYFKVKYWDSEFVSLCNNILGVLFSSCLVNIFLFRKIYAPWDIISYKSDTGFKRYDYVKAIRMQKVFVPNADSTDMVKLNSFNDFITFLNSLGGSIDLANVLEPITKEKFDNIEIVDIPLY